MGGEDVGERAPCEASSGSSSYQPAGSGQETAHRNGKQTPRTAAQSG